MLIENTRAVRANISKPITRFNLFAGDMVERTLAKNLKNVHNVSLFQININNCLIPFSFKNNYIMKFKNKNHFIIIINTKW